MRIATSSENDEAWLFPVSLGMVSDGGDERLTFSSDVDLKHPLGGSEIWLPVAHESKSFSERTDGVRNAFRGMWIGMLMMWDKLRKKGF